VKKMKFFFSFWYHHIIFYGLLHGQLKSREWLTLLIVLIHRSITMTGFWPYELLGTSLYTYVHHDDMPMLASVHQLCKLYIIARWGTCDTCQVLT
jgi:hypothetical protein